MKEVTVGVSNGKKAVWANDLLTLDDDVVKKQKDDCSVIERIKTLEDALSAIGTPDEEIADFFTKFEPMGKDVVAYMKLRVIVEALNEGWKPQYTEDEYRYYPWFVFYTQKELDKMDEEYKQRIRVLGRSDYSANAGAGVAYSSTGYASSHSHASSGGRLCFKERALAEYAGRQFLDIWIDFLVTL